MFAYTEEYFCDKVKDLSNTLEFCAEGLLKGIAYKAGQLPFRLQSIQYFLGSNFLNIPFVT